MSKNGKDWPHWNFPTKREWLRDVRKRWTAYRKAYQDVRTGCAFYPGTVTMDREAFEIADKKMRDYYKNT